MSAQGTGRGRPSRPSLPHSTTLAPTEFDGLFVRLMPLGPINDSVGKFCKHVRTSPFSERRTEHYEKNLHMQRKRAAKAGFCLVPALVSLSVQSFPTES